MYPYDNIPMEYYTVQKRPKSAQYPRPVSKNFNRISDFIFPDTVHVRVSEHEHNVLSPHYHRTSNYSLPMLNRSNSDQRDLIIVERCPPANEFDHPDFLYHEHTYQPARPVRRRYSSYIDEQRSANPSGFVYRPAVCRDRIRERRKRHTTDNTYHSVLRSMIEEEEQIDETMPMKTHLRTRQRHASISSRDSSSDTDTIDRQSIVMKTFQYETTNVLPTVWERPLSKFPTTEQSISSSPFDNLLDDHQEHDHRVSLCVDDLRTTLFIDEETLNKNNQSNNELNQSNGKVIKGFIDRLIKRLRHFKRSLDTGLIHVRKRHQDLNQRNASSIHSSTVAEPFQFVRPYFLIRPQTVLVLLNETAKFKCCFGGDPTPQIVWSHNECRISDLFTVPGSTLSSTRYRTHKLHDIHYLDIGPINENDQGEIKCVIHNRYGREEILVQLLVVPTAADGVPSITIPLNDVTINEGHPLNVSCSINGLQVTVSWFHNGKLVSSLNEIKSNYKNDKAIFNLSHCTKSDAGTLDCLVKNRFGEVRTSCHIKVIDSADLDR